MTTEFEREMKKSNPRRRAAAALPARLPAAHAHAAGRTTAERVANQPRGSVLSGSPRMLRPARHGVTSSLLRTACPWASAHRQPALRSFASTSGGARVAGSAGRPPLALLLLLLAAVAALLPCSVSPEQSGHRHHSQQIQHTPRDEQEVPHQFANSSPSCSSRLPALAWASCALTV